MDAFVPDEGRFAGSRLVSAYWADSVPEFPTGMAGVMIDILRRAVSH